MQDTGDLAITLGRLGYRYLYRRTAIHSRSAKIWRGMANTSVSLSKFALKKYQEYFPLNCLLSSNYELSDMCVSIPLDPRLNLTTPRILVRSLGYLLVKERK